MKWNVAIPMAAGALFLAACADAPTAVSRTSTPRLAVLDANEPVTGAIFTTLPNCQVVNGNTQYTSRQEVYLNGGPQGGTALKDADYYVRVVEPDGTILGTSPSANYTVVNGIGPCTSIWTLVLKQSDGTEGYDKTSNPGGEYKVIISSSPIFTPSRSKSDNYKIREPDAPPPPQGLLTVQKFYDANANGVKDGVEPFLSAATNVGWQFTLTPFIGPVETRLTTYSAPREAGYYTVTESMPIEPRWYATTPTSESFTLTATGKTVMFGNVCTVIATGGRTLGYQSNKNGQALQTALMFGELTALKLVNANGSDRDFTGSLTQNRSDLNKWLLAGEATNMAYMLSVQLATLKLTVMQGTLDGNSIAYPDGRSLNQIISDANDLLTADQNTKSGNPNRVAQEAIKTLIDNINNNLVEMVKPTPCAYTFQ
jgi:hypothetical protein